MATSGNMTTLKTEKDGEEDPGSSGPVYKGGQQDEISEMAVIRYIQIHDQLESSMTRLAFQIRQVGDGLISFESARQFDDIGWCRAYVKASAVIGAQGPDATIATVISQMADCCQLYRDLLVVSIPKICPNLAVVAGDLLAARLIAKAGSVIGLASMSASTLATLRGPPQRVRVRGRKALEFSLIYQSDPVQSVATKNRLKMVRRLANKCVLAAREDCYAPDKSTDYGCNLLREVQKFAQIWAPSMEGAPDKTSPEVEDDEDSKNEYPSSTLGL